MWRVALKALVAGVAAVLASGPILASPPTPPRLGFTDLTAAFAEAYDKADGEEAVDIEYYNAIFAAVLPRLYEPQRYGPNAPRYIEVTGEFLATYPQQREAIAEVSRRFAAMFDPAVVDFEERVGTLPLDTPVFLIVSMGEFDGATRYLGGRENLLFGADMIAKLHTGNARPFVQHELFHIYHSPRMGDCYGLYCNLWTEGLATYAALTLNPDASDADLLLTIPEPIRPALDANRNEAICTALRHLDSRDINVLSAFFSGSRMNARLPPRFGYLVGLWVAQDLGRKHALTEMAGWSGTTLRTNIERSLHSMSYCPAPPSN